MGATLSCWTLPLAAAALPWRLGYALLHRASAWPGAADPDDADAATHADRFAAALGAPRVQRSAWVRERRLLRLVDNTDLFLSRSRGDRWIDAYVDVVGRWPERGPFLALTAHWGAGLFALRHLRRASHRARFLLARIEAHELRGARRAHAQARVREVERATGAPVIFTGGAVPEIERTWRAATPVIALCDAPLTEGRSTITATSGAVSIAMPAGLIRLACAHRIPVVLFAAAVNRHNGRRRIDIANAGTYGDTQRMADAVGDWLAKLVASDTAAWHLWPFAPRLLTVQAAPSAQLQT